MRNVVRLPSRDNEDSVQVTFVWLLCSVSSRHVCSNSKLPRWFHVNMALDLVNMSSLWGLALMMWRKPKCSCRELGPGDGLVYVMRQEENIHQQPLLQSGACDLNRGSSLRHSASAFCSPF